MDLLKKIKILAEDRESFILKRDNHESLAQGFLFSIALFFTTQYFGIPDKYDTYIYIMAFVILIVAIVQIGMINYEKIKEIKGNKEED